MEAHRAQSAIMDSLTETKEFDNIKIAKGDPDTMVEMHKDMPKHPQSRSAVTALPAICTDNAQPMGRSVWTVPGLITLEKSAQAGEIQLSTT